MRAAAGLLLPALSFLTERTSGFNLVDPEKRPSRGRTTFPKFLIARLCHVGTYLGEMSSSPVLSLEKGLTPPLGTEQGQDAHGTSHSSCGRGECRMHHGRDRAQR